MSQDRARQALDPQRVPVLPAAAVELISGGAIDAGRAAEVMRGDAVLCGKVLNAVNSGHFGLDEPCTEIERAVNLLEPSTVRTLAVGLSLVDLSRSLPCRDLVGFWRRCLRSGAIARRIAVMTGSCDPQEVFLAALMQDIGMLAMQSVFMDRYQHVMDRTRGNHRLLPDWENAMLGFTHAHAGAHVGRQWGLSDLMVEPILRHHAAVRRSDGHGPAVNAVVLACQITSVPTARPAAIAAVLAATADLFDMSVQQTRTLLEMSARDVEALAGLEGAIGDGVAIADIVEKTSELLVRHELQARREAAAAPPAPDPGTAQVRRFERELAQHFEQAARRGRPLGVILGAVDTWESIVEALGPDLTAAAAEVVASRLRLRAADVAKIYRLAPALFAAIVPGGSRLATARLAERMRQDVGDRPCDVRVPGGRLTTVGVTMTLGVAVLDATVRQRLTECAQLMHLGRRALVAAHNAGRNCVRVHRLG